MVWRYFIAWRRFDLRLFMLQISWHLVRILPVILGDSRHVCDVIIMLA
jgi:hypothetical protein